MMRNSAPIAEKSRQQSRRRLDGRQHARRKWPTGPSLATSKRLPRDGPLRARTRRGPAGLLGEIFLEAIFAPRQASRWQVFEGTEMGPNILLGVTGSVAAIYTPQLFDEVAQATARRERSSHTKASLYFFDRRLLPSPPGRREPVVNATQGRVILGRRMARARYQPAIQSKKTSVALGGPTCC